jgi:fructoselysine and glucoselysine-specific PTS system IID component
MIQASWNYERQMNMGYLFGMAPIINNLYKDPEDIEKKKEAYKRHMLFFNCTPQTASFIMGLTASMEEKYYQNPKEMEPDAINGIKTSLMGPLSGIGDSFFQGTVRILAFGLGVSLAKQGSILGPILAMIISFFPSYLITYYGGKIGYNTGNKYLTRLTQGGLMDKVLYVTNIVGLMVIGAMIASLVDLSTPIAYGKQFDLQDTLDDIVPKLIPLLVTFFMFWLIKKKVKTGWLLAISIVGGIVLSVLGILS